LGIQRIGFTTSEATLVPVLHRYNVTSVWFTSVVYYFLNYNIRRSLLPCVVLIVPYNHDNTLTLQTEAYLKSQTEASPF